ncbi:MAG: hypothetical protein VYD87_17650 [Pseudomonadota bacterium]|nr:hypothetical protein [Pseudomonadota bacterium]MEE3101156.1 hypothetical protein [Pseudomonadota bacterium]
MSFPDWRSRWRRRPRPERRAAPDGKTTHVEMSFSHWEEAVCTNPFGCGLGARPWARRTDLRLRICPSCVDGSPVPIELRPADDFESRVRICPICAWLFGDAKPEDDACGCVDPIDGPDGFDDAAACPGDPNADPADRRHGCEFERFAARTWAREPACADRSRCWMCGFSSGAVVEELRKIASSPGPRARGLETALLVLRAMLPIGPEALRYQLAREVLGGDAEARVRRLRKVRALLRRLQAAGVPASVAMWARLDALERHVRSFGAYDR